MKFQVPWRSTLLAIAIISLILLSFVLWEEEINAWMNHAISYAGENYWLVALILFALLVSDILLPIPSSLASTLCGVMLGGFGGFLTSFLAMSVSAMIGYFIGRYAAPYAERCLGEKEMTVLRRFETRGSAWLLLGLRPVPMLAETSVLFAGLVRLPLRMTMGYLLVGNAIVSAVYAITGAWLRQREGGTWVAFLLCCILSGGFMLVAKWMGRKQA